MRSWLIRSSHQNAPAATATEIKSEVAQFHGVTFRDDKITHTGEAEENELAIRSSLIYFKHRWPGRAVVVTGPDAFYRRTKAIADEIGVRVQQRGSLTPGSG